MSMRFSRQEHWSGLPFPSAGDLPVPGTEPRSPALQAHSLPTELPKKPLQNIKAVFFPNDLVNIRTGIQKGFRCYKALKILFTGVFFFYYYNMFIIIILVVVSSLSHVWLKIPRCSLPGSSVHGLPQAGILEWVAISFSRVFSWPRDRTWPSFITGRFLTYWATRKPQLSF